MKILKKRIMSARRRMIISRTMRRRMIIKKIMKVVRRKCEEVGISHGQSKEAGRKEEGQLTPGKTRTALNLYLQKVCFFYYHGRVDHEALI